MTYKTYRINHAAIEIIVGMLILVCSRSDATENKSIATAPSHQKQFFVDRQGQFYAAKATPLYFHVSATPDAHDGLHTLNKFSARDSMAPVNLPEGLNIIENPNKTRHNFNSLLDTDLKDFEIYIDGTPPVSEHYLTGSKSYKSNDTIYYGPGLNLTFKVTDNISGNQECLVSIDRQNFQPYSDTIKVFNNDRFHTIQYYSVDNVGNEESINEFSFYTDVTPPSTTIEIEGIHVGTVLNSVCRFALSCDDNISGVAGIFYRIDGGAIRRYSNPIEISNLNDGEHTLTYWSADKVENSEVEKKFVFVLDTEGPVATVSFTGDYYPVESAVYVAKPAKAELTAIDPVAGLDKILYHIDEDTFHVYSSPIDFDISGGIHTLEYYAVDKVNNRGELQSINCFVDLIPPVSRHVLDGVYSKDGEVYVINKATTISLSAMDLESGVKHIEYQISGAEFATSAEPITIENDGTYTLSYRAIDNVKNIEDINSISIKVDNTPQRVYTVPKQAGNEKQWRVLADGTAQGTTGLEFFLQIAENPSDTAQRWTIDIESATDKNGIAIDTSGPLMFSKAGINTVTLRWPEQKIGYSIKVSIDNEAPASKAVFKNAGKFEAGDALYYGADLGIELEGLDNKTGIRSGLWKYYYAIDGADFVQYTKPVDNFIREKKYLFAYYSVDSVGNSESINKIEFIVDLSAPETRQSIEGVFSGSRLSPESEITLSSSDNLCGVGVIYYRFDEEKSIPYRSKLDKNAMRHLDDGPHILFYYAVDNVGNAEKEQSFAFTYDKTPPGIDLVIHGDKHHSGNQVFISPRTRFSFASNEVLRSIKAYQYHFNSDELTNFTERFACPDRIGTHSLAYRIVDNLDNFSPVKYQTLYLDKTPPVSSISYDGYQYSTPDKIYISPETLIAFTASDGESGVAVIQYRIDKGAIKNYSGSFTVKQEGNHIIDYWALDRVNNREAEHHAAIFVDDTPPSIEISFSSTLSSDGKTRIYSIPENCLIYLDAKDSATKIDLLTYSINGGNELVYRNPLTRFSKGQSFDLTINAFDLMRNQSSKTLRIQVQ